jgi:hypothetical protein
MSYMTYPSLFDVHFLINDYFLDRLDDIRLNFLVARGKGREIIVDLYSIKDINKDIYALHNYYS